MPQRPHTKHKSDMPVAGSGLDEFEVGLLAVARHFIISFAAPDTQSWAVALAIASERWGISQGARAAVSMLTVIDAMRRARRSMFHFSDPHCPTCRDFMTPNERHLMQMIHTIRAGRVGDAQTEAMLLCEGAETTAVLQAAWGLAGLFPSENPDAKAMHTGQNERVTLRVH